MSSRQDSDVATLEELLREERQEAEERAELERRRAEEERRNRKEADERTHDEQRLVEESFVGTEQCGLCRLQLPWGNLLGLEAWQCAFRAVLCLDPNDEDAVELTSLATFSNVHDDQISVKLTGYRHMQEITIIRRRQNNQNMHVGRVAFCFHNWCYEILMWKVKSCTKSEIYRLARTLSLSQVALENGYGDRSLPTLRWLEEKSSCRVYPFFLSQLPPELRHSIWEMVSPRTASNAFTLVEEETSHLVHALNCSNRRDISLNQGSYISLKMITVFGTAYVQDLDNREGSKAIPGLVIRLTFAMSLDGICAIKLFGIDWDTGWLGEIPTTGCIWYGTIQDMGSTLTCSYNDLYCTYLSSPGACVTNLILWDQPDLPSFLVDPDAALFDFERDLINSRRPMLQKPQRRFFGYLPLYSGSVYISGLTVYLSGNGIIGLEAHFTGTSQLSGSRNGCPKYFPLYPGERIAHAWLRVANSRSPVFAAPALTIQTTLGRSHLFGPYVLPNLVMANRYKWILLGNRGCIMGFYYEKPIARPVIMRLGVVGDGNPELETHQIPQFPACDSPYLPSVGPGAGLFLSVAVLSGLKKVELCRVASRCTGVMIHYFKALPVVLGQWHASYDSQQTCLYDDNGPSTVSKVYFRTSRSGDHEVVTDISFSADKSKDCDYRVFGTEKPIAWWFSKLDDVICNWEGNICTVPEESIVKIRS